MNAGERKQGKGREERPRRGLVPSAPAVLRLVTVASLLVPSLCVPPSAAAEGVAFGQHGHQPASAPPRSAPPPATHPAPPSNRMSMAPGSGHPFRPGNEHLPEWLASHQNLTLPQQENLLRREPGFGRLSPDQQQRVLNRLRSLDARPPAERQRILAWNEAFERLSPERKQDVRAAAQALNQMPPGRQYMLRHAFHDLRQIPPRQRQAILNSARFTHEYTPQERHILSSLLSVEPDAAQ